MARTRRVAEAVEKAVEKAVTEKLPRVPPIPDENKLSLGLTLLNCGVSGEPDWGIAKGLYVWWVGDSETGKTWGTMQVFAEAAMNPAFDKHELVFDNAENGVLMDIPRYFGTAVARRMVPPRGTVKKPKNSQVIEDFYYAIRDRTKARKPFIEIVDSMDALDSKDDEAKFDQKYAAALANSNKKIAGSFGMSKPKFNSDNIKRVINRLPETGSILMVISQTRDNPDAVGFADNKRASGGRALRFYAHVQIWTDIVGSIRKPVNGKNREIGKLIRFRIRKNRISGNASEVVIPFLRGVGFDETGSCIDYLCNEKHWKRSGKEEGSGYALNPNVEAPEFNFDGRKDKLVELIESSPKKQARLRKIVGRVWKDIDEKTVAKRKPRYT